MARPLNCAPAPARRERKPGQHTFFHIASAEVYKRVRDLKTKRKQITVNLEAVYMGSKLVAPRMVEREYGRIISFASIQGRGRGGVQRREGRHHRLHKVYGGGIGALQHSGERRCARFHAYPDVLH